VPECIRRQIFSPNGRIQWHPNGADEQLGEKCLEGAFGAQHQRHPIASADAEIPQPARQSRCGRLEFRVGNWRFAAVVTSQVNMCAGRRAFGVPAQCFHEGTGGGGNGRRS